MKAVLVWTLLNICGGAVFLARKGGKAEEGGLGRVFLYWPRQPGEISLPAQLRLRSLMVLIRLGGNGRRDKRRLFRER